MNPLEFYGTDFQVRAQRRVYRISRIFRDVPDFINQGRAPVVVVRDKNCLSLLSRIVDLVGYVHVFCDQPVYPHLKSRSVEEGLHCDEGYITMYGNDEVVMRARSILEQRPMEHEGLDTIRIDQESPPALIREIQIRQADAGLFPFPGYFMRGTEGNSLCLVFIDRENGDIVGAISTYILLDGGIERPTAFIAGRFVTPRWQGRRISKLLTASCIVEARQTFGAGSFWANNKLTDQRSLHTSFFSLDSPQLTYVELRRDTKEIQ